MKGYFERRRLLKQQMELLSKESKNVMHENLPAYSHAMAELEEELSKPHPIFIVILFCILIYPILGFHFLKSKEGG